MKFAFGREPVFVREGGSIGAVVSMEKVFRCPVLFLGLSLPEHGYHAPNENYDWQQACGGMILFPKYFEELSLLLSHIAPNRRPARLPALWPFWEQEDFSLSSHPPVS